MKFMVLLLVLLGYVVIAESSFDELPVHPGVGGLYKGPNSETIIKGPDGSVITAKEEGGSIETQIPLEPIVAAEEVRVEPLVPVVPVVNADVASAAIDSAISVSTPAIAPVVATVAATPVVQKVEIVQPDPHIIETEIVDAPVIEPQQSSDLIGPSGSISTRGSSSIISGPASTTISEPAKVLVATPLVAAVPVIASVKTPLYAPINTNVVPEVSIATVTASPINVVSLQPGISTVTSAPPINTASISPQWTGPLIAPSTRLSPSLAPQWVSSTIAPPVDLSPSIAPQWVSSTVAPPVDLSPNIAPQWAASTIRPPSDLPGRISPQWTGSTVAPPTNLGNFAISTPQTVSTLAPPTSWQPVRNSPAPLDLKYTRVDPQLSITTPSPGGASLYRQETVFGDPSISPANPTINFVGQTNGGIPKDENLGSIVNPSSSFGVINNIDNTAQISSTVHPDILVSTLSPPSSLNQGSLPPQIDLNNINSYETTNNIDHSVQITSTIRPDLLISTINPFLTQETLSRDISRIDSNQVALNNRQFGLNPSLIPSANIIPAETGPLPKGGIDFGSTATVATISRNRGVVSSTELPNIQRTEGIDNVITDNSLRNSEGSYSLDIQVGTDGRLDRPIQNQILTTNFGGRNVELLRNTNPIGRIPQEGLIGSELSKQGIDPSQISLTNVPLSSVTHLASENPYSVSEIVEDTSRSLWNRYGRNADEEESENKEK